MALASVLLGKPVLVWISDQRAEGLTWRTVAQRLAAETDGRIDVTPQTVLNWAAGNTDTA